MSISRGLGMATRAVHVRAHLGVSAEAVRVAALSF